MLTMIQHKYKNGSDFQGVYVFPAKMNKLGEFKQTFNLIKRYPS